MAKQSVLTRHKVVWPTLAWVWQRPHRVLGFGFGSGLIRPGSGTWGSVLALALWWPLYNTLSFAVLGVVLVVMAVGGVWVCQRCVDDLQVPDHVGIVWDEIASVWLVLWVLPAQWWVWLVGFALFRVFDVTKPLPIRYLDAHVHGGLGVMLDDWVAAIYAAAAAWVVWWAVTSFGGQ